MSPNGSDALPATRREIDVLFLVGVDPLRDFPDAALARRALANVPYKVVVDISSSAMPAYADAMLPAAPYLEKDGHYTDWEGRSQRLRPVRPPLGLARSEWEIFQELSEVMGVDMGFHSLDALHEEMASLHRTGDDGESTPRGSGSLSTDRIEIERPQGDEPNGTPQILFSYPLLVDEGSLSSGGDRLKTALEDDPFLEISQLEAEHRGLRDGDMVRLRTTAGEAT